jgi:hypothetical protein
MFLEHFEKHLGEAIGRIGRETFRIREMADGEKCTIEIGGAVDDIKFRTIGHIRYSIEQSA